MPVDTRRRCLQAGNLTGLSDGVAMTGTTGGRPVDLQYAARWTSQTAQPIVLAFSPQLGECASAPSGFCTGFGGPISPNGRYVFGYATEGESRAYEGTLYVDGSPAPNVDAFLLRASQITDGEVIVGSKDTGIRSTITQSNVNQAYRFEAGVFVPLGALPGAPAGTAFESTANSINSSGVTVGRSEVQPGLPARRDVDQRSDHRPEHGLCQSAACQHDRDRSLCDQR